METNNFEQQVAANNEAQKHAQEIMQTRVGGLGGSDAAIVYKIGLNGLAALTATDMKRLAIMTGKAEQENWGGNAYTHAGHAFEDYAERVLPLNENKKREEFIERKLARNFKTFAHADFTERNDEGCIERLTVVECKFVQDTTANTISKYYAQLQWYYMLGADAVVLYHGQGTADPFEVETCELMQVERDEQAIKILLAGIKTLDDALAKGWEPDACEKVELSNTPEIVQQAFFKLVEIKAKQKEIDAEKEAAQVVLKEYIEDWGLQSIFVMSGETKHQVTYTSASTALKFDADKFLKEHPEFDRPEYYKKTKRAASIMFK